MTDSPLMQDVDRETVESLRQVIKALERDKKTLASENMHLNASIDVIKGIIRNGDKVAYCAACGLFHATVNRCDCTAGIDFD